MKTFWEEVGEYRLNTLTKLINEGFFHEMVGVDEKLIKKAITNNDIQAIHLLSIDLLAWSANKVQLENKGATDAELRERGPPNLVINTLVCVLLLSCHKRKTPPPIELCQLVMQQIGLGLSLKRVRNRAAWLCAAKCFAENPNLAIRQVARKCGVNAGTVSRWLDTDEFFVCLESMQAAVRKN